MPEQHAGLPARDALRHELKLRLKALFGRRTEKLDPAQLELFLDGVEAAMDEAAAESEPIRVPAHDRRRRGRTPLPADLPRERVVHDLTDAEKACPGCGEQRLPIAETTREVLDVVPAQLKVVQHVRPVYLCPTCSGPPVRAPAPKLPLRKGYAGAGLLAMIAVSKFADHAPLYRQEGMLARSGIDLSRSTLCGWLGQGATLVEPLVKLMRREILASKVIQTDDTPVPTLGLVRGRAKQARIWSYVGDDAHRYVAYEFTATREGKWPQAWLGRYTGDLQSDAYAGYDALGVTGEVRLVGCWAHARRKFYDHRTLAPAFCGPMLKGIGALYEIEKAIRGKPPDERLAVRRARGRPIMAALLKRLRDARPRHLPKSPIAGAIDYVLTRRRCFTRPTPAPSGEAGATVWHMNHLSVVERRLRIARNCLRCDGLLAIDGVGVHTGSSGEQDGDKDDVSGRSSRQQWFKCPRACTGCATARDH